MFDMYYYGYLGFTLGPDGRTLYYLTGGAIHEGGKAVVAREARAPAQEPSEDGGTHRLGSSRR